MIKAVIFDLDGTLLDTLEDLTDSLNVALNQYGYPTKSMSQVRTYIGNGMERLVFLALNQPDDYKDVKEVYQGFKDAYANLYTNKSKPYPNVVSVLKQIQQLGLKMAVCSNKNDMYVWDLVKLHFPNMIEFAIGEKDGVIRKPNPMMVQMALDALKVEANECLYVGDSIVDIKTAKAINIPVVALTYGFNDKEDLVKEEPEYLIDEFIPLLEIIKQT